MSIAALRRQFELEQAKNRIAIARQFRPLSYGHGYQPCAVVAEEIPEKPKRERKAKPKAEKVAKPKRVRAEKPKREPKPKQPREKRKPAPTPAHWKAVDKFNAAYDHFSRSGGLQNMKQFRAFAGLGGHFFDRPWNREYREKVLALIAQQPPQRPTPKPGTNIARTLEFLSANPGSTIRDVETALGIPWKSARSAVRELVLDGWVHPTDHKLGNRWTYEVIP